MYLEILRILIVNKNILEEKSKEVHLDSGVLVGIVKKLIGNDGDLSQLSSKQIFHYNNVIKPLIERVPCSGVMGFVQTENGKWHDTCNGDGVIDEESLFISYQEDDFKCQICRFDSDKQY